MNKLVLFALAIIMVCASEAQAQMGIFISGGWAPSVGAHHLSAGAGSDLNSAVESLSNQVSLTVTGTSGGTWRIDAKHVYTVWHDNLKLSIRRTGDGIGGGSIFGGLSYRELDIVDTQIFSGSGDLGSIPLQIKLDGLSLKVPPNTYSAMITYTLVEIE